jgi:hypothetical protein
MKDIIIVGSGMSGITAAKKLQDNGFNVKLIDKGRGIGGRMASRRIPNSKGEEGVFDFGAQYFTVKSEKFKILHDKLIKENIVQKWSNGFKTAEGLDKRNSVARFIGRRGIRDIAKNLAADLNVLKQTKVESLEEEGKKWKVNLEDGESLFTDAVIFTSPVPQSLQLVKLSDIQLPKNIKENLEKIKYLSCYAVMAVLNDKPRIPEPGGLWFGSPKVRWIADNKKKGISKIESATILTGSKFSEENWELSDEEILESLNPEIEEWIGYENIQKYHVHRWRYSQPIIFYDENSLLLEEPLPLGFAGDAFFASRIEGAYESGLNIAERFIEKYSK